METAAAIGILVAVIAGILSYHAWLRRSVQSREFHTRRPEHEVRALFERKVAGLGWSLVDDDNPMVAQSPLLAGRRQQIALHITRQGDGLHLRIGVVRLWTKGLTRVPYKAHTLRMRMKSFEKAVGSTGAAPAGTSAPPVPFGPPEQPSAMPVAATPPGVLGPNPFTAPPSPPSPSVVLVAPPTPEPVYPAASPPPFIPAPAPSPTPAPATVVGPGVPPPYFPPAPAAGPPPAHAEAEQAWWITN